MKKINYKDETFCNVIKNSNHISHEQALKIISSNRLANYEKQGVIKKLHYMDNSKKEIVYELTKKGREWIKRNFSHLKGNFYISSTAIWHNVVLAEQVTTHPNNWLNERDLRDILLKEIEQSDNRWELMRQLENGQISVPDGAYRNEDGSIQCVEIINENYTSRHLESKANFQKITNIPITYIKQ